MMAQDWILLAIMVCGFKSTAAEDCQPNKTFNETRRSSCDIKFSWRENITEITNETCGRFEKWNKQPCVYQFNFTTPQLRVREGTCTKIDCDKGNLRLNDKTIATNGTVLSSKHHGKTLVCYNETANETDAKNATVNILSIPIFLNVTKEFKAVVGERFSVRVSFFANPPVKQSDVRVQFSEKNINDFFFRAISDASYEIMIDLTPVTTNDFGIYNVTVSGVDEYCDNKSATISVNLISVSKSLTAPWFVAIGMAALAFLLLIAFVITTVKLCRRKDSKIVPVSTPNNTSNRPQQPHFQSSPAVTNTQTSHANQSFDDEFDDDDYEQPRSPTNRPPMPLPPTARGPPAPRSPRHPARPVNDQHQRPLPSPVGLRGPPVSSSNRPRPPPSQSMIPPHPGGWNSLAPGRQEYSTSDYQENYLNDGEVHSATLKMQNRMYR